MMKKSKIFFGLAACCAFTAMTSCSSDDELLQEEQVQPIVTEKTATSYVTVSLAAPKGGFNGRAAGDNGDNFDNGTESEGAISNVLLVFYDNAGRAVASSPITLENKVDQTGDPSVETIYTAKVALGLTPGTNMPTRVVAFVNPQNEKDQLVSISELEDLSRTAWTVTKNGTKYFTMNNSVYYDRTGNKVITAPLTASTKTDAGENEFEATIYVERLAAKVGVARTATFQNVAVQLNPNQVLTFTPEKWALTATENETYLIKNLPATQASLTPGDASWTINDFANKRSYWAQSSNYDLATFPMTGCDVKANDYELTYLSYNNVNDNGIAFGETAVQAYCLENTGRGLKWTNAANAAYNPFATATSVLLVGSYAVTENGTAVTYDADGFYVYNNIAYNKADLIDVMASGQPYVVDADGNAVANTNFTVAHIHSYRGVTKTPSNRVGLQLDPAATDLYYKADGATDAVAITEDNRAAVNEALALYANSLATHYVGSKAFFYIPIEHFGLGTVDGNPAVVNGTYGVVRNHYYKVSINSIKNLGYGINDLSDPLLPVDLGSEDHSVDVTFNINAWHIMSQVTDL